MTTPSYSRLRVTPPGNLILRRLSPPTLGYLAWLVQSLGRVSNKSKSVLCRPQSGFDRLLCSETMREVGEISYCLYLIHWGILWMIFRFVLHTRFGDHLRVDFTVAPITLLLSLGIAKTIPVSDTPEGTRFATTPLDSGNC